MTALDGGREKNRSTRLSRTLRQRSIAPFDFFSKLFSLIRYLFLAVRIFGCLSSAETDSSLPMPLSIVEPAEAV
jgi:hypothetical protein